MCGFFVWWYGCGWVLEAKRVEQNSNVYFLIVWRAPKSRLFPYSSLFGSLMWETRVGDFVWDSHGTHVGDSRGRLMWETHMGLAWDFYGSLLSLAGVAHGSLVGLPWE